MRAVGSGQQHARSRDISINFYASKRRNNNKINQLMGLLVVRTVVLATSSASRSVFFWRGPVCYTMEAIEQHVAASNTEVALGTMAERAEGFGKLSFPPATQVLSGLSAAFLCNCTPQYSIRGGRLLLFFLFFLRSWILLLPAD